MRFSTVALVRGINVGGRNKLAMADLRAAVASIGGGECETYIQSGNAVCAHPIDPSRLADEIERRAGFLPGVVIVSAPDFIAAATASPFDLAAGDGRSVHIYFAQEPIEFDIDAARALASSTERVAHDGRCVYLSAPDGVGRSKLATAVERFASAPLTARNGRTVLRMRGLLGRPGDD